MCGIVFYGSATAGSYEMEYFERALVCDTFRGYHSTGAFVGYQHAEEPGAIVTYAKEVGEGWDFIKSKAWNDIKVIETKPVGTARTGTKIYPKFAVGHNRHATMGAKTAKNAHPFQHGDVTLVHNGTMDDPLLLVDNTRFEVDSDNICYAINKQGIAETIKQMDGAYTLIWHDARDNTLNILRNEQRPFHLLETTTGDWLGASEEEMLLWLQCRNKYNIFSKYVPAVKRHFECEVGVQYIFDVANGKFELKEEVKHELPTFPSYRGLYGNYGGWNYGSSSRYGTTTQQRSTDLGGTSDSSATPSTAVRKSINQIIEEDARLKNVKVGDIICFQAYQFDAYPNKQTHGKITGMIDRHEDYVEVQGHHIEAGLFQEYGYLYGEIKTAYNENGVVTLIVDNISEEDKRVEEAELVDAAPFDVDTQEMSDEIDDITQASDGSFYTRSEWENNPKCICGWCSGQIAFEDANSVSHFNDAFICHNCYEDVVAELSSDSQNQDDPHRAVKPSDTVKTFVCQNCAREKEESQESKRRLCCNECYKAYYERHDKSEDDVVTPNLNVKSVMAAAPGQVIEIKKVLKNSLILNYENWLKMNKCFICKDQILWRDAEAVIFNGAGTTPICLSCEAKMV